MATKKPSEFDQTKEIMKIQERMDIEKHDRTMVELEYRRKSDQIHHENEMERGRIKSAEIRKMQMRKQDAFRR